MGVSTKSTLLKISELARESGFPISTIRHYINEGLIGNPREKSRNMAYYDPEAVPRISLIKRLQDELFLPLKLIKKLLGPGSDLSFEEYTLFLEVRDRLEEHGDLLPKIGSIPQSEIAQHLDISEEEFGLMEKSGVVSPDIIDDEKYYDEIDFRILKACSAARASGFSEEMSFGFHDLELYTKMLRDLVKIESRLFVERVSGHLSAKQVVEVIQKGLPAVNEVINSIHQKFVMETLDELLSSADAFAADD